jgi:hypothetical protein
MPGKDTYIDLGNGKYVHVPADATPEQLSALRVKLRSLQQTPAAPDPLTQQTQVAAPETSTRPFFEKPPVGTPFPSTNPIEQAGQRLDLLGKREGFAAQSPTPVSDASAIYFPAAAARQIIGGKVGAKVGSHFGPYGPLIGGATGSTLVGAAPEIGEHLGRLSAEIPEKIGLPGGFKINRNTPLPPESPEAIEEAAQQRATRMVAERTAEEKAGLRRPAIQIEAEKRAKVYETEMNQEAAEHEAIRKRYEKEQAAQTKAQQAERAHREEMGRRRYDTDAAQQRYQDAQAKAAELKAHKDQLEKIRGGKQRYSADAAQETFYADQAADLQKRITANEAEVNKAHADWNQLNDQWAEALNRRGPSGADPEAEGLANATKNANEKVAKTKVELGKRLARLNELRAKRAEAEAMAGGPSRVPAEVWNGLSDMEKARIYARWEQTQQMARESGMVHASRGASGERMTNAAMTERAIADARERLAELSKELEGLK